MRIMDSPEMQHLARRYVRSSPELSEVLFSTQEDMGSTKELIDHVIDHGLTPPHELIIHVEQDDSLKPGQNARSRYVLVNAEVYPPYDDPTENDRLVTGVIELLEGSGTPVPVAA